ncbi:MAG: hypothetical protein JKY15_01160 [Deltaproteobacteria bacterium]|nr:hypothetical protein [Deltaproteobacteria bacterium]
MNIRKYAFLILTLSFSTLLLAGQIDDEFQTAAHYAGLGTWDGAYQAERIYLSIMDNRGASSEQRAFANIYLATILIRRSQPIESNTRYFGTALGLANQVRNVAAAEEIYTAIIGSPGVPSDVLAWANIELARLLRNNRPEQQEQQHAGAYSAAGTRRQREDQEDRSGDGDQRQHTSSRARHQMTEQENLQERASAVSRLKNAVERGDLKLIFDSLVNLLKTYRGRNILDIQVQLLNLEKAISELLNFNSDWDRRRNQYYIMNRLRSIDAIWRHFAESNDYPSQETIEPEINTVLERVQAFVVENEGRARQQQQAPAAGGGAAANPGGQQNNTQTNATQVHQECTGDTFASNSRGTEFCAQ